MWMPTLEAGAPEADVSGRAGSRHAPARPAVGTAPRRQTATCSRARSRPASAGACRTRESLDVPVVATPIRILLVTARPEDEACGYIDHRASALPLVEAMEALAGPGAASTSSARPRCRRCARSSTAPAAHASRITSSTSMATASTTARVGLGGLCFEHPQDIGKLEKRRHVTVFTSELGPLLRDHRIPLVFLEACQTAQAEKASESVASELLKVGVASVVAMSHSVLVETARRFVEAFYDALAARQARGRRHARGPAPAQGRHLPRAHLRRGRTAARGLVRARALPGKGRPAALHDHASAGRRRRTFRPRSPPASASCRASRRPASSGAAGSCSRSSGCCAHERYAVVRGQGGEGKTALAAEFARWMVRSHQIRRAAFVSVETHSTSRAVLDALGRQLVEHGFSSPAFEAIWNRPSCRSSARCASSPRCWSWTTWRASSCRRSWRRDAGGPLRGGARGADSDPRAVRAAAARRATRDSSSPAARRCPRRSMPGGTGASCTSSTARMR